MIEFDCIVPDGVRECVDVLGRLGSEAQVIAGGTDLHVLMKTGVKSPACVVYIGDIQTLRRITLEARDATIGAAVRHAEIASDETTQAVPSLAKASASIGSPQVRNVGTVGGNLANASPAADLYPPLLTLEAVVDVESCRGRRRIPLEDFALGPGRTRLEAGEIVTAVRFRMPPEGTFSDFVKIGLRNALAVSVASAAIRARADRGRLAEVRVACGAVAPTPTRMRRVEALVEGASLTRDLLEEARSLASQECDPITDIRATREYRRRVAGVIVARLIEQAGRSLLGLDFP